MNEEETSDDIQFYTHTCIHMHTCHVHTQTHAQNTYIDTHRHTDTHTLLLSNVGTIMINIVKVLENLLKLIIIITS